MNDNHKVTVALHTPCSLPSHLSTSLCMSASQPSLSHSRIAQRTSLWNRRREEREGREEGREGRIERWKEGGTEGKRAGGKEGGRKGEEGRKEGKRDGGKDGRREEA